MKLPVRFDTAKSIRGEILLVPGSQQSPCSDLISRSKPWTLQTFALADSMKGLEEVALRGLQVRDRMIRVRALQHRVEQRLHAYLLFATSLTSFLISLLCFYLLMVVVLRCSHSQVFLWQ